MDVYIFIAIYWCIIFIFHNINKKNTQFKCFQGQLQNQLKENYNLLIINFGTFPSAVYKSQKMTSKGYHPPYLPNFSDNEYSFDKT